MRVQTHNPANQDYAWRVSAHRSDIIRWGWLKATYGALASRFARHLGIRLYRVYVRQLDGTYQPPSGITIRVLTLADLRVAEKDPTLQLNASMFVPALARGDFCVGAFVNERLVSYVWRSFSTTPAEDGFSFFVPPGYRYGYKAFTRSEHRGRRLHNVVSRFSDRMCLARGFQRGVSYVETHNFASIASARKRGNRCYGYLLTLVLGHYQLSLRSPGAKRLGVAFTRSG